MHVLLWKFTISYTPREPEKITDDNSVTAAPKRLDGKLFNVSNCSIIILLNNQMKIDGNLIRLLKSKHGQWTPTTQYRAS